MKKLTLSVMFLLVLASPSLAQPECPPDAVDLASFRATRIGHTTYVQWTTGQEIDNAGFNVYGGSSPFGTRRKLNADLIPAMNPGGAMGNDYGFIDGIGHAYYWLEDVDAYGVSTFHGSVHPLGTFRLGLVRLRPVIMSEAP